MMTPVLMGIWLLMILNHLGLYTDIQAKVMTIVFLVFSVIDSVKLFSKGGK